jgi:hypothetical protein
MDTMPADALFTSVDIYDIQSAQMQTIAEHCGMDDALAIMAHLPGLELYIPAFAKKVFDWEYVKENYTGYNAATIAGHLGLDRADVIRLSKQPAPPRDETGNGHLRLVAEKCGLETARRLAQKFPGEKFYINFNLFPVILGIFDFAS